MAPSSKRRAPTSRQIRNHRRQSQSRIRTSSDRIDHQGRITKASSRSEYSTRNTNALQSHAGYLTRSLAPALGLSESRSPATTTPRWLDTLLDDNAEGYDPALLANFKSSGDYLVVPSVREDGSSPFDQSRLHFECHQDYAELFENVNDDNWIRIRDSRTIDCVGNVFGSPREGFMDSRRSLHHYATRVDSSGPHGEWIEMYSFVLVEVTRTSQGELEYMTERVDCRKEDVPKFDLSEDCEGWMLGLFRKHVVYPWRSLASCLPLADISTRS